jgi:NAD(P) transhydrogenase subunit alpha
MVESMAPGSVLVDLAAERGGNIELTQPGKTITTANGATIIGFTNVAGRLATSASQLYSRNLVSFLETLIDKKEKVLAVNWDDELVKATVLTRDGAIVHPNIKFEAAPAATRPAVKVAEPAKTAATGKQRRPRKRRLQRLNLCRPRVPPRQRRLPSLLRPRRPRPRLKPSPRPPSLPRRQRPSRPRQRPRPPRGRSKWNRPPSTLRMPSPRR